MKRGQGAFEYILLLAGVLLIVVLAIIVLRSSLTGQGGKGIDSATCRVALTNSNLCWDDTGAWDDAPCDAANECDWSMTGVPPACYNTDTAPFVGTAYSGTPPQTDAIAGTDDFFCTTKSP